MCVSICQLRVLKPGEGKMHASVTTRCQQSRCKRAETVHQSGSQAASVCMWHGLVKLRALWCITAYMHHLYEEQLTMNYFNID